MTEREICYNTYNYLVNGDNVNAKKLVEENYLTIHSICGLGENALILNNTEFFIWIVAFAKDLLRLPWSINPEHPLLQRWLDQACDNGNLEAVKVLIEKYGGDVNSKMTVGIGTIIYSAASSNNAELVDWLLEHGADPNYTANGCNACYALQRAAHKNNLAMVKTLVEHGGLINGLNAFGVSPLTYAKMGGSQEVIDYLKSQGALEPWQIRGDPGPPEQILPGSYAYHLLTEFGNLPNPFAQDITQPDSPTIHLLPQEMGWILVTEGMSSRAMNVPDDAPESAEYRYAELLFRMPKEWPGDQESMQDPKYRWVLDWLFRVARWPFENNTTLGQSKIFVNGEPPEPLAEGVPFKSILVVTSEVDLVPWEASEDKVVRFYCVFPLFDEERELERRQGISELMERLGIHIFVPDSENPQWLDPNRENVGLQDPQTEEEVEFPDE